MMTMTMTTQTQPADALWARTLEAMRNRIRRLEESRKTATARVVATMPLTEARLLLQRMVEPGRALALVDADLADLLAARSGLTVQWQHQRLYGDAAGWQPGRGKSV